MHNEKELLRRIADGDETAFSTLYTQYDRLLYSFLWKLTKSSDTAEEIVQETFLRVWLNRDKFPEVEHPRAYIFRIASNIAATWLGRRFIAQKAIDAHQCEQPAGTDEVQEALALKDLSTLVARIIAEMPEQRRQIYLLHREAGLRSQEIADQLGLSPSTVRNTIATAIRFIREKLAESGYGLSILLLLLTKK